MAHRLPIQAPLDLNLPAAGIHLLDHGIDERQESLLSFGIDNPEHIIGAGFDQPLNRTKGLACGIEDGHADQIAPVELVFRRSRQGFPGGADPPAFERFGTAPVLHLCKSGNQTIAVRLETCKRVRLPSAIFAGRQPPLRHPPPVERVIPERMHPHPAFDTVRTKDAAQNDDFRVRQGESPGESGSLLGSVLLDQTGSGGGELGAVLLPVGQTIHGNAQTFFMLGRYGVIKADALHETAITAIAGVSHDQVVEGALLGTTTSKANNDHCFVRLSENEKGRIIKGKPRKTREERGALSGLKGTPHPDVTHKAAHTPDAAQQKQVKWAENLIMLEKKWRNSMNAPQTPSPDPVEHNVRLIITWLATHRDSGDLELEELNAQLDILRQTPLPPLQHLKLLEMLFMCLDNRLQTHMHRLTGASIPLARKVRHQVNTLQEALDGLALGYESLITTLPHEPSLELSRCLERAAFCLHRHLYISYLVAAPAALGIWQRLHAVFLRSQESQLEGDSHHPAPLATYREALLLASAQPASFSSRELTLVAEYVHAQAASLDITALPPADPGSGFWIDPGRDFPAFALSRRPPPSNYRVFYFSCKSMARQAELHLKALSSGARAKDLQLPELADTSAGKGTLRRLASFWGQPGKRRFPRRRQSHRATLCAGLDRLWQLLRTPESLEEAELSQWMITNESPDGYALMHLHGKSGRLRVGDLIGLRPDTGSTDGNGTASPKPERWQIGLVRWALSENPEHIEIGLQILAPEATPALLAIPGAPNRSGHTSALILPELPPLRQSPVLVVPAGAIEDQHSKLLLLIEKHNLEIREVRAQDASEQTGQVEVFPITPDAS